MLRVSAAPVPGHQLQQAMFQQRIGSLEEVSTLPDGLRQELAQAGWAIERPRIVETFRSVDGTERYLVAGQDGQTVETVWMPGGDGAEQGEGDAARGGPPCEPLSVSPARSAARSIASSVSPPNWVCRGTCRREKSPAR